MFGFSSQDLFSDVPFHSERILSGENVSELAFFLCKASVADMKAISVPDLKNHYQGFVDLR